MKTRRTLRHSLVFFFIFFQLNVFAQGSKIESFRVLLKNDKEDTNKINHLNKIADAYFRVGYYDSATISATNALQLSIGILALNEEKQKNSLVKFTAKKGIAAAYNNLGNVNREQGNYPKALEYFLEALKIDEEIKDKHGIGIRYSNIGSVYRNQADYPKAIDYYFKALKIAEELGDKKGMGVRLGNIGNVYWNQAHFTKIYSSGKTSNGISLAARDSLFNLALDYYLRALKIDEGLGDKLGVARHLGNIGNVYFDKGIAEPDEDKKVVLYNKALEYYLKTIQLRQEQGANNLNASVLGNVGTVYAQLAEIPGLPKSNRGENYQKAFVYLYRAIALSDSVGARNLVKDHYLMLSALYEKSIVPLSDSLGGKLLDTEGMRLRSLHYFKNYLSLRDTLFSEENKKQLVRKEMNFEFEKKETALKAEQEKKDALAKAELDQKEKERNYFITGFGLVIVLAGFIFRGYKQKQKANSIISHQKELVEEKQKEILDSIHYAKRIQKSLLPSEKYIERNLKRLQKK